MRPYLLALAILFIVLITHIYGVNNGLYVDLPQLDMLVHTIAGAGIGLLVYALISRHNIIDPPRQGIVIIVSVLCVGFLWECFEAYFDIARYPLWSEGYFIDTAKDFLTDLIGGASVAWFAYLTTKKERETTPAPDLQPF